MRATLAINGLNWEKLFDVNHVREIVTPEEKIKKNCLPRMKILSLT